jgi:Sulfotransferase domain
VRLKAELGSACNASVERWRRYSAPLRCLPDVVILGAQRAGTTSLFNWLAAHPSVAPSTTKEVHYFDLNYAKGERWYRSHFPLRPVRRMSIEATPYLLFHPLAPGRAAVDLPGSTRFVVLLRDPVQRAISHYWHSCRLQVEHESLEVALCLEHERLAGQEEIVLAGGESPAYQNFSYMARGHYAEQLRRWFDVMERGRFLVMASEELFVGGKGPARVLEWLGLSGRDAPFPASNDAPRARPQDPVVVDGLRRHFAPHNDDLFELLGTRLWSD